MPSQQEEQYEQVSVLDGSYEATPTPRSDNTNKQVIFQAFDEYVGQESSQGYGFRPKQQNRQEVQ